MELLSGLLSSFSLKALSNSVLRSLALIASAESLNELFVYSNWFNKSAKTFGSLWSPLLAGTETEQGLCAVRKTVSPPVQAVF